MNVYVKWLLGICALLTLGTVHAQGVNGTLRVATFPAASVEVTTSRWSPAALTLLPLENAAPSSVAVVGPGCASVALKEMLAGVLRSSPEVTPAMVMTGAVKSSAKATLWLAVFPARSAAVTTSRWSPAALTVSPEANGAPSSVALTVAASVAL